MPSFSAAPAPSLHLVPREAEQLRLFELGPDIQALRSMATTLTRGSRSANTERAYAADRRDFQKFCATVGRNPLPASEETLCWYVADSLKNGLKIATLQRRICAVMDAHKRADLPWPGGVLLRDVLRGARRAVGSAQACKAALMPAELRDMCTALEARSTSDLSERSKRTAVRDRALLSLGFFSGMRRSELCALNTSDVQFVPKGLLITIRRSKTDQEGYGRTVGVFASASADVDPVRLLRAWLQLRGREAGPIFPGNNGKALTGTGVGLIVNRACGLIGLDPAKYGAHSLRAGFVTTAAELGMPETLIMQRTGHKSVQTVARYVRPARLFQTDALAAAF